jgi:hypothetical protein
MAITSPMRGDRGDTAYAAAQKVATKRKQGIPPGTVRYQATFTPEEHRGSEVGLRFLWGATQSRSIGFGVKLATHGNHAVEAGRTPGEFGAGLVAEEVIFRTTDITMAAFQEATAYVMQGDHTSLGAGILLYHNPRTEQGTPRLHLAIGGAYTFRDTKAGFHIVAGLGLGMQ